VEAVPEETGGPYPGDGSNGPNVLVEEGVVRQDIRSSFGDHSGTASGIVLNIALQVVEAASGAPREGAAVYAWHCTADGVYSLYSQGLTNENFLRGVQAADADGNLSFTSIYPGAYSGRWPHIHFEVFEDVGTATSGGSPIVTSQLALPEGASREAYLTDGYGNSLDNLGSSSIDDDMVFRDGYDSQMATVLGDPTAGYTASLVVAV
jgi:protocatechuate 3,4-dioxygenase beta subunit